VLSFSCTSQRRTLQSCESIRSSDPEHRSAFDNLFSFIGRPFVKRFALCYRSVVCLCPVCLSVTFVHCGQTVGRIKMKLGMQVGLGPGHIVLDGDSAPPLPKGHSLHPIFGPYLLRPNGCMDHQDATWYAARPQPRRLCEFVLDGDPALHSPKKGQSPPPQFSAHFYCGQMALCIKMPLDMAVGLSPGDFVLDRDPPLSPNFSAHVCYSYCDFVTILHNAQSLLVVPVQVQVLVFYAFYF